MLDWITVGVATLVLVYLLPVGFLNLIFICKYTTTINTEIVPIYSAISLFPFLSIPEHGPQQHLGLLLSAIEA